MQDTATSWDLRSLLGYPSLFLMMLGSIAVVLVPVGKVLRRTGHNALWCLCAIVPVLNIIMLWLFAFKPWSKSGNTGS